MRSRRGALRHLATATALALGLAPAPAAADCASVRAGLADAAKRIARPPYDCRVCGEKAQEFRRALSAATASGTEATGWSSSSKADKKRWEEAREQARCAVEAMSQEVAACNAGNVGPFRVCAPTGGGGGASGPGGEATGAGGGKDPLSEAAMQAAAMLAAATQQLEKLGNGADSTSYQGSGSSKKGDVAKQVGAANLDDAASPPEETPAKPDWELTCAAGTYECERGCCHLPDPVTNDAPLPELTFPGPEAVPAPPQLAADTARQDTAERDARAAAAREQSDVLGVPLTPVGGPSPSAPASAGGSSPSPASPATTLPASSPLPDDEDAPSWTATAPQQGSTATAEEEESRPKGGYEKAIEEVKDGPFHAPSHDMDKKLEHAVTVGARAGRCFDEPDADGDCKVRVMTLEELLPGAGGVAGAAFGAATNLKDRWQRARNSFDSAKATVRAKICGEGVGNCTEGTFLGRLFGSN